MTEDEFKSKDSSMKEDHLKDYLEDNSDEQIRKAEDYLKKINNQLTDRLSRIDKIKKSHEKFEKPFVNNQLEEVIDGAKNTSQYLKLFNKNFSNQIEKIKEMKFVEISI